MRTAESNISNRLAKGLEAIYDVQSLILKYYQNPKLRIDFKADLSQVTEADRLAELRLKELILQSFPDDGILGEEFGEIKGKSGFVWILDPIDGTQSFVCGVPLFGTLIGVTFKGDPVLGIVNFPALSEAFYAQKGHGAWWKNSRTTSAVKCSVSQLSNPQEALVCSTTSQNFSLAGKLDFLKKIESHFGRHRGWGDCYGHMLVASGRAEIMLDPLMNLWDCAALYPIVTEAGGSFMDFSGVSCIDGGSAISTNASFKQDMLDFLVEK